jgi:hypothetical protein
VNEVDPPPDPPDWFDKTNTEHSPKVFALAAGSGLELRLVHDSKEPHRAVELWTSRTIYWLDAERACIAVIDRQSGKFEEEHSFLGARLAGGEERDGAGALSLAHPYPLPGMRAVFLLQFGEKHRYGRTSVVENVILRVRVTNVNTEEDKEPTWDAITGRTGQTILGP